jgi:hypothetical protein
MSKTNFKKDFDEYLKKNPDFYENLTDSSYFELADWYTEKYAPEICKERNTCEAYEFARWVFEGIEQSRPKNPGTRDHVVSIRERYEGRIDFDKWLEYKDDDLFNLACKTVGLDPNSFKYEEEGCMSRMPQVDYDRLRVGDLLWYRNIDDDNWHWDEVVVTHTHGGVVFLKKTSGDDQDEFWLPKESFGYYLGLYPKKVILPKGTKCTCYCELTEFEEES